MPTMKVRVNADGTVDIGPLAIDAAAFTTLAPMAGDDGVTGKAVKLQDARVVFDATPSGSQTPVEYTVSLMVTRGAVNDSESHRIAIKAEGQKARKDAKVAETEAERKRLITMVQETERSAAKQVVEIANATTRTVAQVLASVKGQ